jgi:hypothetical protein
MIIDRQWSWESGDSGRCQIRRGMVEVSTGRGIAAGGGSCTLEEFLGGRFNELLPLQVLAQAHASAWALLQVR